MSRVVTVRVVMPKRAVSKLSKKLPPEEWGELLEKSAQNAKAFKGPAKLPSGAEVTIELKIPQKASRKISYLARKWGVSWPVVIWTLLQADEIPVKETKKKEKKTRKRKIKHKEPEVPETRTRAIMNDKEKEELLREAGGALVELNELKEKVDSLKLLIGYVTGESEKGKEAERVAKKYLSEIEKMYKEIERIGRKVEKDKATPKDIEKLEALTLGVEALKEKLQEEEEAWGGMFLDDTLSEEGVPEEDFKIPRTKEKAVEEREEAEAGSIKNAPVTVKAPRSLRSFFNLAKKLGAKRIQVTRDGRIEFLSEDKTSAGTYPLDIELPDDLVFELPKNVDFSKLRSLTLSKDGILFELTDGAELVPAEIGTPDILIDVEGLVKTLGDRNISRVVLKWDNNPYLEDLPFAKEAFEEARKVLREAMKHGDVIYIELPSGKVYSAGKDFPEEVEDIWKAELEGRLSDSIWAFESKLPKFVVERGDEGVVAIKKKHLRTIFNAMKDWDYVGFDTAFSAPNTVVLNDGKRESVIITALAMPDIIDVYFDEKDSLPRYYFELEHVYGPAPEGFKHRYEQEKKNQ